MNHINQKHENLFFVDFQDTSEKKWYRNPGMTLPDVNYMFSHLDLSNVKNLRIFSHSDLAQMVNKEGKTEEHCRNHNEEFDPHCQKAEWIFDERYKIDDELLEALDLNRKSYMQ